MHKTKNLNDDYLGSGKLLRHAIKKYGRENFEKEILFLFENEEQMREKEFEIITEDFLNENSEKCYNLLIGGKGGFGFITRHKLNSPHKGKTYEEYYGKSKSDELKKLRAKTMKITSSKIDRKSLGLKIKKTFSERGHPRGTKGKIWATNGKIEKFIHFDNLPIDWKVGRLGKNTENILNDYLESNLSMWTFAVKNCKKYNMSPSGTYNFIKRNIKQ